MTGDFRRKKRYSPWRDDFEDEWNRGEREYFPNKAGRPYVGRRWGFPRELKENYLKMGIKRFQNEFEPLIDVLERRCKILVVAELQGAKRKEDVEVKVQGRTLIIVSKSEKARYYRALDLPKPVKPKPISLLLKNGVLLVELKKLEEGLLEEEEIKGIG